MAKYQERIRARIMRKQGTSIVTIAKELRVSKSATSLWCRDILLTSEQVEKLKKQKGSAMGRWMGAESNRKKKRDAINAANDWGEKHIKKISKRELLLIAAALYWSEGSKSDSTSGFIFVNSDPEMILVMKLFLVNVLGISTSEIVCSIQINRIHEKRINTVLSFWKKLLHLRNSQFRKPYYVNTKISKVYDNYENYYGICRLVVRKGKNMKYKMLGLIQALKADILSG
jgi:hypothetical protein